MSKVTGSVKWFNDKKGYGFIAQKNGADIFVHFREINMQGRKTLLEGQVVSFEITNGKKGLQAQNVTLLNEAKMDSSETASLSDEAYSDSEETSNS